MLGHHNGRTLMTTINGTTGNDTLVGDDSGDNFYPDGGVDTVTGGAGDDTIYLNSSTPELAGTTINGGAGNNSINCTGAVDLTQISFSNIQSIVADYFHPTMINASQLAGLTALSGDIEVVGSGTANFTGINLNNAGNITIGVGVTNVDLTKAQGYFVHIHLGDGNINLTGGSVQLLLTTGNGNETIIGSSAGDDISIGSGATTLQEGIGNNTVHLGTGVEHVTGGSGNDTFYIDQAGTTIIPGQGIFLNLPGPAAGSVIDGGAGNNTLYITASTDLAGVTFKNIQTLNASFSVQVTFAVLQQFTTLIGQFAISGTSPMSLAGKTIGDAIFTLDPGGGSLDASAAAILPGPYNGIQVIGGSNGPNIITGTAGNDGISCGGIDDVIHAGAGNDNVNITSNTGNLAGSTYDGGTGNNVLYLIGSTNSYDLSQANVTNFQTLDATVPGTVKLTAAQLLSFTTLDLGALTLANGGTINMNGIAGAGYLGQTNFTLSDADTTFDLRGFVQSRVDAYAGGGTDTIYGLASGTNHLYGGAGNATLVGGGGTNFFTGGTGHSTVEGGSGQNTILCNSAQPVYQINEAADGSFTLTDVSQGSPNGSVTGINVHLIEFSNTSVDLTAATINWMGGGNSFLMPTAQTLNLSYTYGNADNVTASNGTINLTSAQTAVAGNNNIVTLAGNGDAATLTGTGDRVTGGGNGIGALVADVARFSSGGTLAGLDNSSLWVGGDGVSATLGASDYLSIVGSAETVAIGGAGSAVTIGGNGQTAAVADAVIASGAASVGVVSGSRVNLNGSSLGVVLASNDTIGLAGSAEVVSASGTGDLVFLGANGIGASVADLANFAGGGTLVAFDNSSIAVGGNGVSAVLGNSDYLNIVGSSEVVTITGTSSAVTIGGNGQLAAVADAVVASAAAAVGVVSGSRVNLNGSHLAVFLAGGDTIGLAGSGENVYASGAGNLVFLGGNGIGASVADGANFAGGGALVGFDNSNLGVSGNGVSVSLGSSDYLNIVGANETVSVSGAGSAVTIGGNGQTAAVADMVSFAAGGAVGVQSNSSVSVSGNGVNVALGNSDTLAVSGLNETLSLGVSDALSLAGHFGVTTLAGFGATDQITLSGAIFPGAATGFDYWAYLLGHATVTGGNTNITIGSDTLVLQNYALTAANKGQFHFG